MSTALHAFQHAFAHALRHGGHDGPLARQPGFAVYRNTVMKGCIDALHANYPAVARLVGDDWFRAAAAEYVRAHPPHDVRLMLYSEDFGPFLARFAPAAELPYLPDVARLDRSWSEAHVAADAPVLQPADLASLPEQALSALTLTPHPAARWHWFDDAPIHTLWSSNRQGEAMPPDLAWRGEGALLTRPHGAVQDEPISRATCAFLDACAAHQRLPQAIGAALNAEPTTDVSALLAQLMTAGALRAVDPPPATP